MNESDGTHASLMPDEATALLANAGYDQRDFRFGRVLNARVANREVSEWMNNDTFVRSVIDQMYPHLHQQRKRSTFHWLIDQFFRRMTPADSICETLGLSHKGLESKLARFKKKGDKSLAEIQTRQFVKR